MAKIAARLVIVSLVLAALARTAAAAEHELLALESIPPGTTTLRVLDVPGQQVAQRPAASMNWRIKPGKQLKVEKRPADRIVELYTGTPQALTLLCRLALRYFPNGSGWTPYYRLDQEPLVALVNGRWVPLEQNRGVGALIALRGNTLPNAEGFFPTLEFGLGSGSLSILAWQVH